MHNALLNSVYQFDSYKGTTGQRSS